MESLKLLFTITVLVGTALMSDAQNVGINTATPEQDLEIEGATDVFLRLNSNAFSAGTTGIELFRSGLGNGTDWKIESSNNKFRILRSEDNFATTSNSISINNDNFIGVGTDYPVTRLHVMSAQDVSNTSHGAFVIGSVSGINLAMDRNELIARDDGGPATLYVQSDGGNTVIGMGEGNVGIGLSSPQSKLNVYSGIDASNTDDGAFMVGWKSGANIVMDGNEILARNNNNASTLYMQYHGGNTSIGQNGGDVKIGTTAGGGRLNIADDLFQLYLRNDVGDVNDWYIGVSNSGWVAGDDQLVFSPTATSGDGILRLNDVWDNDGQEAPLAITSSAGGQRMLFDGNEIDTDSPLYINHNSGENTYLNPSGGHVGVGTNDPDAGLLHVSSAGGTAPIAFEREGFLWVLTPKYNGDLRITRPSLAYTLATIDALDGSYSSASDRRLKEQIRALPDVLPSLDDFQTYSYHMKNDPEKKLRYGVIAQEMLDVFPNVVVERDGFYGVQYDQLTVVALRAVQELAVQNESLSEQVKRLQGRLDQQQKQLDDLHSMVVDK